MSIADIVDPIPKNKEGLMSYLMKDKDIRNYVNQGQNAGELENALLESMQRYKPHMKTLGSKVNSLFSGLGLAGDAYFFVNPVAGLGIKFLSFLGKSISEIPSLFRYATKTGDYLSIPKLAASKAVSYLPGLTLADAGLSRLVKKRLLKDTKYNFLKKIGKYRSVSDMLKDRYTGVRDRSRNRFRPDYQPAYA